MFERIKRLYVTHKLSEDGLRNALDRGWITQEQYELILSDNSTERIRFYCDMVRNGGNIDDVPEGIRDTVRGRL